MPFATLTASLTLLVAAWAGCGGTSDTRPGTTSEGTGGKSSSSSSSTAGNGGTAGSTGSGGTAGAAGGTSSSTGGTAGSGGGTMDGGSCGATEKLCGSTCVSVDDPLFGCGPLDCTPCSVPNAAPICAAGACVVGTCSTGFTNCDGDSKNGCEVDTANDPTQCGACGNACAVPHATAACVAGICEIGTCAPGYVDCNADATDGCEGKPDVDPTNCGTCNTVCPMNETCEGGACGVFCDKGLGNCDGDAANGCETPTGTVQNCAFCGDSCALAHASSGCDLGACTLKSCDDGWADCDGIVANGCETHTDTSAVDCGACNNICQSGPNSTPVCKLGQCSLVCDGGFDNCDQDPATGCELPVLTDPTNCGACTIVCTIANGTPGCAAGACTVGSCNAGFGDCDGLAATGCEVNTNATVTSCGSCGNLCSVPNGTPTCTNGACAVASCNPGFGNCNGQVNDGCETDTNTSLGNCGGCGTSCTAANGTPTCAGGTCNIAACNNGYADCDGQPGTGCEINLNTSVANCGGCGNGCSLANATPTCTAGACAIQACNQGFADCDGNAANGCEVDTTNSVGNCGTCGNTCNTPNATPTCTAGACAIQACNGGFADCNTSPADGCEVDTTNSVGNCGTCGNTCTAANGTPSCVSGACAIGGCAAGFADCNNLPSDGCEINTGSSVANCGTCGHGCTTANGTPSCVSGACAIGACAAGFADCNGNPADGCEINTKTSVANCGSCGGACNLANAAPTCNNGACAIASCNAGFADCNGNSADGCEINTNTNTNSCGTCGHVCTIANGSAACAGGACAIATCNAGYADCNSNPADGCEVNTTTSIGNCGTCGNTCVAANGNPTCTGGSCAIASCTAGFADCNNSYADGCEINTKTNTANCGVCGNACNLANASSACTNGGCTIATCNAGFADCDANPADGCEVNTAANPNNCGTCGNVCAVPNAVPACTSGACAVGSCNAGFADCNATAADGCETNTNTSVASCGSCGNACSVANGTPTCNTGSCAVGACSAGFANCNNSYADGCEINTNTSLGNCGSCGNTCTVANGTPACNSGSCAVSSCAAGFANCNGSYADGCEVNTNTNTNNCGSCGHACSLPNATAACSAGGCTIQSCNAGFADCNGNPADGCEVNLLADPTHCGSCTTACGVANGVAGCSAGACTVASCNAGFANCNGLVGDGCEINTNSDPTHCGSCTTACSAANGVAGCSAGACTVASCNAGFANCNGLAVDGCEINTTNNPNNCGFCGNGCSVANGTAGCAASACTVAACNSGFANCNGLVGDGCEINTTNNTSNCGACGNSCATNCSGHITAVSCTAAACGITGCAPGWFNIDGTCAGGCECQSNGPGTSCNLPSSLGTLSVGQTITTSGNLVPTGTEGWYTVTFTGNTNFSYHPRVRLSTNPGAEFQFDIRTNCSGASPACGNEGGVANGKTDWDVVYTAGDPNDVNTFNPIPAVGNSGQLFIHVYRKAGAPTTCGSYTLTVSN